MALSKEIILDNGVVTKYHRVVSVNTITNVQDIIEVASYTSPEKRKEEQAAVTNGDPMNVYIHTRFVSAPYGSCPTVTRAYEGLKANVEDFADAEDVLEETEGA